MPLPRASSRTSWPQAEKQDAYPASPGGQQQRVGHRSGHGGLPKVILFDEPHSPASIPSGFTRCWALMKLCLPASTRDHGWW